MKDRKIKDCTLDGIMRRLYCYDREFFGGFSSEYLEKRVEKEWSKWSNDRNGLCEKTASRFAAHMKELLQDHGLGIDPTCGHQTISVEGAAVCPKCHEAYTGRPALSREDNKTEICPACGTREAMEAFMKEKGIEADA